jgi:hypothetical protein
MINYKYGERMRNLPGDSILASWRFANLLKPSWVRPGKVDTLNKTAIERKLGTNFIK